MPIARMAPNTSIDVIAEVRVASEGSGSLRASFDAARAIYSGPNLKILSEPVSGRARQATAGSRHRSRRLPRGKSTSRGYVGGGADDIGISTQSGSLGWANYLLLDERISLSTAFGDVIPVGLAVSVGTPAPKRVDRK